MAYRLSILNDREHALLKGNRRPAGDCCCCAANPAATSATGGALRPSGSGGIGWSSMYPKEAHDERQLGAATPPHARKPGCDV
mmetsp:Transcript_34190/g.88770  ORF Transcript_34190/g.88770 Transcript_34190/m.88770 type:complete len:83 (+) Transcript_34190:166-414(+)